MNSEKIRIFEPAAMKKADEVIEAQDYLRVH
jgi:hypothetical protein